MSAEKLRIDFSSVINILDDEPKYVNDFCNAAISSFTKFKNDYRQYLLARELANLKNAGHRIKPVAQMLEIIQLLNEYNKAKIMLVNNSSQKELQKSADKVDAICEQIIREFHKKMQNI